jgi:cytochrome c oxidase assembly factor CtaG
VAERFRSQAGGSLTVMRPLGANGLQVMGGGSGLFHAGDLLGAPRADPVGLLLVAAGVAGLVAARRRVRGREDVDPRATGRATVLCGGWALFAILVATCSGLATYAPTDPSAHLIADTLLFAVAGPLLACAGPWTLAFAAAGDTGRARIRAVLASRVVAILTYPVVSLVLFGGLLAGLYAGGLYPTVAAHRAVADLVEVALLATSYLWSWSTVGVDPVPRRRTWFHRICAMFCMITFFLVLGMAIESQGAAVAGQSTYRWHVGGDVIWSTGLLLGIGGLAALLFLMVRSEERVARQRDEQSDEAAAAQLALWRATREAITMEEALARSTIVEERPRPAEPGRS